MEMEMKMEIVLQVRNRIRHMLYGTVSTGGVEALKR
jgi:hypothetical protein